MIIWRRSCSNCTSYGLAPVRGYYSRILAPVTVTIPVFAKRDWESPQKPPNRMAGTIAWDSNLVTAKHKSRVWSWTSLSHNSIIIIIVHTCGSICLLAICRIRQHLMICENKIKILAITRRQGAWSLMASHPLTEFTYLRYHWLGYPTVLAIEITLRLWPLAY
jgi:hypothetical protein